MDILAAKIGFQVKFSQENEAVGNLGWVIHSGFGTGHENPINIQWWYSGSSLPAVAKKLIKLSSAVTLCKVLTEVTVWRDHGILPYCTINGSSYFQ